MRSNGGWELGEAAFLPDSASTGGWLPSAVSVSSWALCWGGRSNQRLLMQMASIALATPCDTLDTLLVLWQAASVTDIHSSHPIQDLQPLTAKAAIVSSPPHPHDVNHSWADFLATYIPGRM